MYEYESERNTLPPFPSRNKYTYPYFFKDKMLFMVQKEKGGKEGEKEKEVELCSGADIVESLMDIDTGKVFIKLVYYFAGQQRELLLRRETVTTRKNIDSLLPYGVDVGDPVVGHVLNYFNKKERYLPLINVHSQVGWGMFEGKPVFKLFQAIGIDSSYQGSLALEPKGTFEGWCKVIRIHVMIHVPLQLALVLGLSSIVLAYISRLTGLETLLFHIFGESTKGKTTALRVAVSPFGLPATHSNGLIQTWDNTNNALQELFRGNFGVPVALDESSVRVGEDLTKLVYNFASGKGRGRLNRDCELRQVAEWSTTMISTGECGIGQNCVQNTGIKMRLIEFGNIDWTTSAENAEAIQQGLSDNYGHAAPILAEYLMGQGIDRIVERWQELSHICYETIENHDAFSQRIANKLAVLLLTAECAGEALNLDFDIDGIFGMLLEMEKISMDTRSLGENAYTYFLETCVQNLSSFSNGEKTQRALQHWGSYTTEQGNITEICILTYQFKEIMKKGGFQDINVILRHWRKEGLIECDTDGKFTRKRTLTPGSPAMRVHVVKVKKELQEKDPEVRKRPRCPYPDVAQSLSTSYHA